MKPNGIFGYKSLIFSLTIGIFALLLGGCEKEVQVIETSKNNNPPPDTLIPVVTQETYINKTYISLLGRKPSAAEMSAGLAALGQNNVSKSNRRQFVDQVLAKPEYFTRLYDVNLAQLLKNYDTTQIVLLISQFELLSQDPQYAPFKNYIAGEIARVQAFRNVPNLLKSGQATVADLHKRMVDNYFYDQINMGSLNWTLSLFESFLNRYPTQSEETHSVDMVDGKTTMVFLKEGSGKTDFVNIFFESQDYFEGQVRAQFRAFLFRDPNSVEVTELAKQYKTTKNFKQMQREVLIMDEFLGIVK